MQAVIVLALSSVAIAATSHSSQSQRIVGGDATTIDYYPSLAGFLMAQDGINFMHNCGGAILNERTILTAAHCNVATEVPRARVRVGSSYGNSGGVVHNIARIINHETYQPMSFNHDIGILHTATHITLNNLVQPATIAGPNYPVPDNEVLWAAGWGLMDYDGSFVKPEQLRHVALVSIGGDQCRRFLGSVVTDNMLCAGSFNNEGGAGQCIADSGGPLYLRNIVVGVCSFTTLPCGRADGASVNTRVSNYTNWIVENAFL